MTVRALIITGHGINCAREMALGFRLAGADPVIVHVNDLAALQLLDFDILALPGGFSFGDHLGAGRALSQRLLRQPLGDQLRRFVDSGRLVWGVCNGFQTLVQLGLLPAGCTLTGNQSGKFECRWVRLLVDENSPCVFTRGLTQLELPVRHGQGRLIGSPAPQLVPLRYEQAGTATQDYPANPNGSVGGAAALCDESGRIFGLMPHPEAFLRLTQHPDWTLRRRQGQPEQADGLELFSNAVEAALSVCR